MPWRNAGEFLMILAMHVVALLIDNRTYNISGYDAAIQPATITVRIISDIGPVSLH